MHGLSTYAMLGTSQVSLIFLVVFKTATHTQIKKQMQEVLKST